MPNYESSQAGAEAQKTAEKKTVTRQEYNELITKEKACINRIIEQCVREKNTIYLSLKAKAKGKDSILLYQFFASNSIAQQDAQVREEFRGVWKDIREAIDFFTQDRKKFDAMMFQTELMFGEYIWQCILQYEKANGITAEETGEESAAGEKRSGLFQSLFQKKKRR